MTTRWRINVYRVPPQNEGENSQGETAADKSSPDDPNDERDWRYADAVYEDVM